jgi:hypothetical protein
MRTLGKLLQIAGLVTTGWAALGGFWIDVSEGMFISFGLGGFVLFWIGTRLRGGLS